MILEKRFESLRSQRQSAKPIRKHSMRRYESVYREARNDLLITCPAMCYQYLPDTRAAIVGIRLDFKINDIGPTILVNEILLPGI